MRSFIITTSIAFTLVLAPPPARACSTLFVTPFDLHDEVPTVALVKVKSIVKTKAGHKAKVSVIETFKGSPGKTLTIGVDLTTSCQVQMKVGQNGVVFVTADQRLSGHWVGFQRNTQMIEALRGYAASDTGTRAKAVLEAALASDSRVATDGAHALMNRTELVLALDGKAKDRIVERLAKIGDAQHGMRFLAARLHDARVKPLHDKRSLVLHDEAALLGPVIDGKFDGEKDASKLAATIESAKDIADRVAAMDRCEQLHGRSLAKFHSYAYDAGPRNRGPNWQVLAEACRTGKPI